MSGTWVDLYRGERNQKPSTKSNNGDIAVPSYATFSICHLALYLHASCKFLLWFCHSCIYARFHPEGNILLTVFVQRFMLERKMASYHRDHTHVLQSSTVIDVCVCVCV